MVEPHSTLETKICTKCGETKPVTAFHWNKNTSVQKWYRRPDCKTCESTRRKAHYAANATAIRGKERIKRQNTLAESRLKERQWRKTYLANNPKEHKAYQKAYRLANIDKSRVYHRNRYALNIDKERAYYRTYHANNLDKRHAQLSASQRRRRAQKLQAPRNDFTAAQWHLMQEVSAHCCAYCGRHIPGRLTQDHVVPLSKGGSHTVMNIVPACKSCNSKKHDGPVLTPVQLFLVL